jgi:putative Mg2+ transporter-C (MgtC) family protein
MLLATSPSLDGWEVVLRLAIAAGLGAAVGVEREVREHEAGVRTHLLVALGSALFTIVGAYGFEDFGTTSDPTRVAAQIVTGIGFLGAGAILREGLSVRGLTTAGSLWVVAAIGMGAGAGYYWAAVAGTALTIFALWPLRLVTSETIDRVRADERRLVIALRPEQGPGAVLDLLADRTRHVEVRMEGHRRVVTAELESVDEKLVAAISDLDGVDSVRWRR